MLYLNPNSLKIKKAIKAFHNEMQDFVFKRIDAIKKNKNINIPLVEILFSEHIIENIDNILIGDPGTILKINNKISSYINVFPDLRKGIEYVFNYDLFVTKNKIRFDAYNLAELLEVSTCVYCNRNYTNTVIKNNGKKLTRPQFDHFFDKATYPLLAISFFNLIPSCSICNSSIKGTRKMDLNNYTHPYIDNTVDDIKFSYKYSAKTKSGLEVKVKANHTKANNTVEAFAIEQVYNSHTAELLELIKTRQYFSDKYLNILSSNLLKGVIVSKKDLYRIVFGTEYDAEKFINRPFSKFKSDILKELGII